MRQSRTNTVQIASNLSTWRTMLWLVVVCACLAFWPSCLDLFLAPRFFFASAAVLFSVVLLWKELGTRLNAPWPMLDLLLLAWYGMNLVSITWSFSVSEGVFYAQKTLLLFGVYWLVRQALLRHEAMTYHTLGYVTIALTIAVFAILLFQIVQAARHNALGNETLYEYITWGFGNKSLAGEFLFFLLVLNALFVLPIERIARKPWIGVSIFMGLFALIFVLQVRTAIVSAGISAGTYAVVRAALEAPFRKIFFLKILPGSVVVAGLMVALIAWQGSGSSIINRLNPLNYLESDTANERRFVWYKTDLLNKEHYWLGVGNGSWKFWLPSKNIEGGYRLAERNIIFTRAHNDYLEIRSEMGIVGAVLFCALFGMAFLLVVLALKKAAAAKQAPYSTTRPVLLAGLGLLGYCIIQYFDFPRERIEFQAILAILLAVIAHHTRGILELKAWAWPQKAARFLPGLLAFGMLFNLWIGWARMRGETHTVRMLEAQSKSDWRGVTRESIKAENPFYQYTDTALPLAWHEGLAWFKLETYEKSALAFERAYRLNPWSFQVINNYGAALVKTGRLEDAAALFEKALSINPRYDEGKFNLALVYSQLGDYPKSEAWLNRVDTIVRPGNDDDRAKNRATLDRLREFKQILQEKRQ